MVAGMVDAKKAYLNGAMKPEDGDDCAQAPEVCRSPGK